MTSSAVEEIQFQVCIKVNEGDVIALQIYGVAQDDFPENRVNFYVEALDYETTSTASPNTLNTASLMNTGSLVGLGDKAEVTDETLEKTKLDEVTEVKEAEAKTEEIEKEGSGDER